MIIRWSFNASSCAFFWLNVFPRGEDIITYEDLFLTLAKASKTGWHFKIKPAPPPIGEESTRPFLSFVNWRISTTSISIAPFEIALLIIDVLTKSLNCSLNKVRIVIFIEDHQ